MEHSINFLKKEIKNLKNYIKKRGVKDINTYLSELKAELKLLENIKEIGIYKVFKESNNKGILGQMLNILKQNIINGTNNDMLKPAKEFYKLK